MSKWRTGIYLRLSSDDDDDKLESNSITNQRNLINYHLSDMKDITVYKCYADDGYTGTDFDRPSFQEMMDDIRSRKINCVVVKDLSRLGRNYINVGHFIDDTIPRYKIRFIAVNDNVDSYLRPESMNSLEVYFKNLMNESFAKDISKKIRTSFAISKKNGNFIGVVAPFGYLKDPDDNHKFIVDKEAEKIIKNIFKMAMSGMSRQEIIKKLNDTHTPTPAKYLKDFCNSKNPNVGSKWTLDSLDKVIKNRNYIGTLIQGKKARISHKKHNTLRVPEDEWIIVPNHHKAIIKEEIFNQVQDILYNRNARVSPNGKMYRYTGFLKCADCKTSMYKFAKKGGKDVFFYCGAYHKKKNCTKHYITEKELDDIVLETINKYIELITNLDEKINKDISLSYLEYEKENKEFKLIELDKEEQKYRKLLNEIKEDYKNDYISKKDLDIFKDRYMFELNKILLEKDEINNSTSSNENIARINRIKEIGKIDFVDRNILNEFVDVIYISEERGVEVIFKYKNLYEDALRYLNS
ncbi:MAG: recombinase family protein [Bacilli bacterium]|nr:recombinase family protein [Bacilli bacterium]MBR1386681.1 recombinase family protein [Bacilli bacterium]